MHSRARDTFHFSFDTLNSLELGDTIDMKYSSDAVRERNAARQQTYRFNRKCRESNINKKLGINERQDGLTITRVE